MREVVRIKLEASSDKSGAEVEERDAGRAFPHLVVRYFHGPVQRRQVVVALDRAPTRAMVNQFFNDVFVPSIRRVDAGEPLSKWPTAAPTPG